jgi:hypothetical protein
MKTTALDEVRDETSNQLMFPYNIIIKKEIDHNGTAG